MKTMKKTNTIETMLHKPMLKKWLYASLAASALALGACADNETPVSEDETAMDAQAEVEQGVTNVDDDTAIAASEDTAYASDDMPSDADSDMMNNDVAIATADESEVADESEILDGSESEEHVSTY
jgi:hypothetical protein